MALRKQETSMSGGANGPPAASASNKQQLAARVKALTGKLVESHGAELRRTLFALRQTFQDDADFAQAFIELNGLECLLKVARDADQIQQNYILRALGQLIGQPAGLSCLARHNETLQWLYKLLGSQHRLVARAALRLLLQLVGQSGGGGATNGGLSESQASQLCAAIKQLDSAKGPLEEAAMESIIKKYINLEAEVTDERQVENMKQREKSRVTFSANIEKHQQQQHQRRQQAEREPAGQHEGLARGKQQRASISSCSSSDSCASYGSGYASGSGNSTDHEHKQRSMATSAKHDNHERQADSNQLTSALTTGIIKLKINSNSGNNSSSTSKVAVDNDGDHDDDDVDDDADGEPDDEEEEDDDDDEVRDDQQEADEREADEDEDEDDDEGDSRLKQHLSELEQLTGELAQRDFRTTRTSTTGADQHFSPAIKSAGSSKSSSVLSSTSSAGGSSNNSSLSLGNNIVSKQLSAAKETAATASPESRSTSTTPTSHLTAKSEPSVAMSPPAAAPPSSKIMTANSSSSGSGSSQSTSSWIFQWEQLVSKGVTRPLLINDLDFTDLRDEDDCDLLANGSPKRPGQPLTINIPSAHHQQHQLDHDSVDSGASTGSPGSRSMTGVEPASAPAAAPPPLPPPPISPWFNTISAGSRPQSQLMSSPSPTPFDSQAHEYGRDQSPAASSTYSNYSSRNSVCMSQAPGGPFNGLKQQVGGLRSASSMSSLLFGNNPKYANKRKKTMKLFWKEVREDRSLLARLTKKKTIWDEIKPVQVDTSKLEYLFESKAKDLALSKSRNGLDGLSQRKVKITVLDAKRSNAINIGMTKLPPMRTIKSAILKMDSSIMNREGIEKILTTMMPTEEEKSRIIEAQLANPDTPLGTAEQFLLNLASISALEARLKLWAFQLDYAQIEKEVAEPLMDLKQAIEEIERSETFRNILGTLLSIGNFLNSSNAKGFQIDYLEKVPEVKDTVHKHSLLHHLCLFIQEKFDPELSSDLYSEFSAVNRASKVDYTEVAKSLKKMQQDCKASWDHLKIVAKHDGLANLMNTCGSSSSSVGSTGDNSSNCLQHLPKSMGKLNNLSKLSMITTVIGSESSSSPAASGPGGDSQQTSAGATTTTKQLKMKVSDFLTDCAERIMVLMVIHRRVMNRFQKLLVYLGCPLHQIKQTQPQHILKIINEFALEYRTKRERVREMLLRKQQNQHHHHHHHHHHQHHNQHNNLSPASRWQMNRMRWAGSSHCIDSLSSCYSGSPNSSVSSCASSSSFAAANCPDCCTLSGSRRNLANGGPGHRAGSPSGLSQISNYSDFLGDQASCCSRQDSLTPVPSAPNDSRRPHSMSVSMMDLQHQQQQQQQQQQQATHNANNSFNGCSGGAEHNGHHAYQQTSHNSGLDENQLARQKDEQLRRLLGAGKSLDEACNDLYQMSHWTSTMARHSRPPAHKTRASSLAPWSSRNLDL